LSEGLHTFHVRTCYSENQCGAETEFATVIEYFGSDTTQDVARVGDANVFPLEAFLEDQIFRNSDALLSLEIKQPKEENGDLPQLAKDLLDLLEDYREYVRNGRPMIIHGILNGGDQSPYKCLSAVRDELPNYPFLEPYVRLSVLYLFYNNDVPSNDMIKKNVFDAGFDDFSIDVRHRSLIRVTEYVKSLGLTEVVFGLKEDQAPPLLAALRDSVDSLTTDYRAVYARQLLEDETTIAHINVAQVESPDVPTVTVRRNYNGTPQSDDEDINVLPTSSIYGRPPLNCQGVSEESYFGCALDYRFSQGYDTHALPIGDIDANPGEGYLISAYVQFEDLDLGNSEYQTIVSKAESSGCVIELYNHNGEPSSSVLRFGVNTSEGYVYKSLALQTNSLKYNVNTSHGHFIVGAYDGNTVQLWVNGINEGTGTPISNPNINNDVPFLIGGDPNSLVTAADNKYFNGAIQQVSVLRWKSYPQGTN
jgi:hypothetical protein